MSPAFLAAVGKAFPDATVTVDWFHVVQLFTKAVDDVRKAERRQVRMPAATRWAVLKAADGGRLTDKQAAALAELEAGDFLTAKAWRIKEKLRWVRRAETPMPPPGGSPTSCATPISRSATDRCSRRWPRPWRPSRNTANESWSDGPQPTATPASKR